MNIREKIGTFIFNRKVKEIVREKETINLNEAKNVGIVFNASQGAVFELIKNFSKRLSSKGIKVSSAGFVNTSKIIDHYLYRKGFVFFTRKQLNWYYKPVEEEINKFVESEFDILIDLTLKELLPLQFIVALSKAKLKVGRYVSHGQIHDMMIDINKELKIQDEIRHEVNPGKKNDQFDPLVDEKTREELSLNFLIEQTEYYLSNVRKDFITFT